MQNASHNEILDNSLVKALSIPAWQGPVNKVRYINKWCAESEELNWSAQNQNLLNPAEHLWPH